MNTPEIETLKHAVKEAVMEAMAERNPLFPLSTVLEVATFFRVSPSTVLSWHKQGLLKGHYQILSGTNCRIVFTGRALVEFFDENFPSVADLSSTPFHPKSSRAQRIKKMLSMRRVYNRRRRAKDCEN